MTHTDGHAHARSGRAAFSLIELLVCVALVGVLTSLVLPALASVRDSGRRTACLGHLHGFGHAFTMYRDQNRELLPFADRPADVRLGFLAPFEALADFMDAPLPRVADPGEVVTQAPYLCPADTIAGPVKGFSYFYTPFDLMAFSVRPDPRVGVTKFLDRDPATILMLDQFGVHARSTEAGRLQFGAKNILRLDGTAEVRQSHHRLAPPWN